MIFKFASQCLEKLADEKRSIAQFEEALKLYEISMQLQMRSNVLIKKAG